MGNTKRSEPLRRGERRTCKSSSPPPPPKKEQRKKTGSLGKSKKLYPCQKKMACCAENPCDRELANKSGLIKHMRLIHKWGTDKLAELKQQKSCKSETSCPNCGKIVANSSKSHHMKRYCPPKRLTPRNNEQPEVGSLEKSKKLFPCKRKMACCAEIPCGKELATKSSLLKHMRLIHKWDPDKLETLKKKKICKSEKSCPNCGLIVTNSSNLSRHLKHHCPKIFTELFYKCSVCEERFNYSNDLKIHLGKLHSLYWCVYCQYNFTTADKLRAHVRVHLQ